jgi:hypothetical protein
MVPQRKYCPEEPRAEAKSLLAVSTGGLHAKKATRAVVHTKGNAVAVFINGFLLHTMCRMLIGRIRNALE